MKKILLGLTAVLCLTSQAFAQSPTFATQTDTAFSYINFQSTASTEIHNNINSTNSVTLNWTVIASDFPADWLPSNVLGICDNINCRINLNGSLWNGTSGTMQTSDVYSGANGDFHMLFTPDANTTAGTHYMTIKLQDKNGTYNTNIVFYINYTPGAGVSIVRADNHVNIYPNPAHEDVNVVFSPNAGVKGVAVYNLIGKAMATYRVSGNSANISLENMPAGIYFLRLLDAQGNAVAIRKFTHM